MEGRQWAGVDHSAGDRTAIRVRADRTHGLLANLSSQSRRSSATAPLLSPSSSCSPPSSSHRSAAHSNLLRITLLGPAGVFGRALPAGCSNTSSGDDASLVAEAATRTTTRRPLHSLPPCNPLETSLRRLG